MVPPVASVARNIVRFGRTALGFLHPAFQVFNSYRSRCGFDVREPSTPCCVRSSFCRALRVSSDAHARTCVRACAAVRSPRRHAAEVECQVLLLFSWWSFPLMRATTSRRPLVACLHVHTNQMPEAVRARGLPQDRSQPQLRLGNRNAAARVSCGRIDFVRRRNSTSIPASLPQAVRPHGVRGGGLSAANVRRCTSGQATPRSPGDVLRRHRLSPTAWPISIGGGRRCAAGR